ncbi:(2Fe-2S)-binding protein [Rahnella victoriana]|jgi:aerobic-type carbon monoxide dehydrogenase small subunit (CoxS/CutS family)|uniref:(2Fe-2S)-binding protein n=1 Tax=Rahnella victoriana TaxID=1510570 RepID=A0ABS0DMF1_9GAMM|nr:(2Fe-2S)-binding protein [Rahnella victoriana]MBF7955068.1 (2Fe-2S)-binding protein [Rahnella victoriana]TBX37207.1 (2Fe-2S)-binding protein [Rahnella victoriana]
MSIKTQPLTLTINHQQYGPLEVPEGLMMIDFLHEYVALTGCRLGCGQGICHACVAIVDHDSGTSEEVRTCITGAHYFNGKKVRTVEGHAKTDDKGDVTLSPVQQAFMEHYSFQCGYCTPGFVNAATLLLERLAKHPVALSELEGAINGALENHICRCTGYVRYYEAVRDVVLKTPGLIREPV